LNLKPEVQIASIFTNGENYDLPEYLMLANPGESAVDLSGYAVTKGVTLKLHIGVRLQPHDSLFLTNIAYHSFWNEMKKDVYEWTEEAF